MSSSKGTSTLNTPLPIEGLSATAKNINESSRRLSGAIDQLNTALKKLNLGIPVWVMSSTGPDNSSGVEEFEEIGYDRFRGKWGICLRHTIEGAAPEPEETYWHFDDAPRDIRLRGAACLHMLIAALHEKAHLTAEILDQRTSDAEDLAKSINEIAETSRLKVSLIPKGDD